MKKSILMGILVLLIAGGLCGVVSAADDGCVKDLLGTSDCNTVHLSWADSAAHHVGDHYHVYRGVMWGGPYDFVASTTNNYYDDPGLVTGSTYYYVVRDTCPAESEICQSAEIPVRISSCGPSVPEFPFFFLPVAMIIGFLGIVLSIRRTREH